MRRAATVALKEWRYLSRGRIVYLVAVQPLIFCFVWGYCARADLEGARLAIVDASDTGASRALVRAFEGSGLFEVDLRPPSMAAMSRGLREGTANLCLVVPSRFTRDLKRRRPAEIQVLADATDPNVASLGLACAASTAEQASLDDAEHGRAAGADSEVTSSLRVWFNPSLRSSDYLLLNAIAYNLFWFIFYPSASLMAERSAGTVATLRASPLTPAELWLGKVAAHGAVALWGTLIQIALAVFVVGVPFRGDAALLFGGLALFALIHLNVACALVAVLSRIEHLTALCLILVLLALSFSSFFLPLSCLPDWARIVAEAVPLKHGVLFLQAVFLKGAGAAALSREIFFLGGFALGTSVLALASTRALLRSGGRA